MRYGILPYILGIFFLGLIVCASAHSQTIIISPTGAPTYVYPGTATAPAIVIPPSGQPTYVYPGTSPTAPVVGALIVPPVKR